MPSLACLATVGMTLAIAGASFGCSGGGSDTTGSPTSLATGNGFTTDIDEGSVRIEADDDGTRFDFDGLDSSLDADLLVTDEGVSVGVNEEFQLSDGPPPGWPSAFPVPDTVVVVRGSLLSSGSATLRSLTYRLVMDPEDILEFYVTALSDAAPIVTRTSEDPERFHATVSFDGPLGQGFLTVSTGDVDTTLVIHLTE